MKQPAVLVVGAGAMGLVCGHHLQLAGAQLTFLVRPGRIDAFTAPQTLYCYDDAELKRLDNYRTIDAIAASDTFDYVLVTLDGATSRSTNGIATLRGLGDAIRASDAHVIMGGVGVGLREHYLQTMQLAEDRLSSSFLGLLAHQTRANLPAHAPTDPARLAQASVAYRQFANKVGFYIESRNAAAAKRFADLYNRCGVSRCGLMKPALVSTITNSAFPMLAASQIAGWPNIAALVANTDLWRLACRAQGEIAALPQHGLLGKLMALVMTPSISAKLQLKLEREMLPLDYQAFNRFHHGGKVHVQDVEVMRNCLAEGRRQGKTMNSLGELLDRLATNEAVPRAATA